MVTAFAGYTAVYALNDVVDYRVDTEKMGTGGHNDSETYLDGVMIRHPLATGIISVSQGVLWVGLWSMLALAGAYRLNPVCMWIFLGGIGLEIIYCLPDPMTTRAFNDDALPFKHIFSNGFHPHPVRSHIHSRHTQVDNRRGLRRPAVSRKRHGKDQIPHGPNRFRCHVQANVHLTDTIRAGFVMQIAIDQFPIPIIGMGHQGRTPYDQSNEGQE
jgi:hypothetical protein